MPTGDLPFYNIIFLFQPDLLCIFFQQFPLQERRLDALAVAVGLVTLADDSDQVALLRMIHRVVQCVQTVRDFHELGVRIALVHAHADVGEDVLHLLKAVVVLGEDGEVGHLGADLAHAVAAQLGAVAAAAEHHHEAVGLVGPQGGQQALGGDLVVGVVQQDGELPADGHQLDAALDHAAAQALVDGLIRQAQHLAHGEGSQRVVDAELAGHIDPDVHIVLA